MDGEKAEPGHPGQPVSQYIRIFVCRCDYNYIHRVLTELQVNQEHQDQQDHPYVRDPYNILKMLDQYILCSMTHREVQVQRQDPVGPPELPETPEGTVTKDNEDQQALKDHQ